MPLLEGYFAKLGSYPADEQKFCVNFIFPHFVKRGSMGHLPILAPSRELLLDWRADRITWQNYEGRLREEIASNLQAMTALKAIAKGARESNIRLLCYEKPPKKCHRFILLDMIDTLTSEVECAESTRNGD